MKPGFNSLKQNLVSSRNTFLISFVAYYPNKGRSIKKMSGTNWLKKYEIRSVLVNLGQIHPFLVGTGDLTL